MKSFVAKEPIRRQGIGLLVTLILLVVAVLFIFGLQQNFIAGVIRTREGIRTGTKVQLLADSAINEAFLDFKSQVNVAGTPWFAALRKRLTADYGRLETRTYDPVATKGLYDESGVTIAEVRVDYWKQRSFWGLSYEKYGLLLVTAVVSIPRRLGPVRGLPIRRNVQRAWEIKQALVTPPRPFDEMTLFIGSFPYLTRADEVYREGARRFDDREKAIEQAMNTNIDYLAETATSVVEACKDGVKTIRKARKEAKKDPFGRALKKVNKIIKAELAKIGIDEARLNLIAASDPKAWLPAAGYSYDVSSVRWPSFRSDGASLNNPVYVMKRELSSSEFTLKLPSWPKLPRPDPGKQVPPRWQDWDWPALTCLSAPYAQWKERYGATLPAYVSALTKELRRHEGIFRIVPDGRLSSFQRDVAKASPFYWKRKASYLFPDQRSFEEAVVEGKTAILDGVYWIDGPLRLTFDSYRGSGVIVAKGDVDIASCRALSDGVLTVVSRKNIYAKGRVEAALMAAGKTIRFGGAHVEGSAFEVYHDWDEFRITYDERLRSQEQGKDRLERLWVTVSPYEIANNFLRR